MRAWLGAQLADPTNVLHGMGIGILGVEVVKHWLTGHPVDTGTIAAGVGCFTVGGVIDHFQAKTNLG